MITLLYYCEFVGIHSTANVDPTYYLLKCFTVHIMVCISLTMIYHVSIFCYMRDVFQSNCLRFQIEVFEPKGDHLKYLLAKKLFFFLD